MILPIELLPNEHYAELNDYPHVFITTMGRVFSMNKTYKNYGIIRTVADKEYFQGTIQNGYKKINLCHDNVVKQWMTHRLVALTFIPNPNNYPCVNHKNGIKNDNRVENLEWCTHSQNTKHAVKNGWIIPPHPYTGYKYKNHKLRDLKLTNEIIDKIKELSKSGISNLKLAKQFNIHHTTIARYIKNKRSSRYL